MTRIVIAGGPKTGKTTLAKSFVFPGVTFTTRHTDNLIHLGWSEASAAAALWFDEPGPWIVEGVATPRALRKWIAAHPHGKPCDVVHWLEDPHEELTPGQAAMTKGCATVWEEIVDELRARGVEIVVGGAGAR